MTAPGLCAYIDATGEKLAKAEARAQRKGCAVCGCPKILYLVGVKGYCGAHREQAYAAAREKAKAWS